MYLRTRKHEESYLFKHGGRQWELAFTHGKLTVDDAPEHTWQSIRFDENWVEVKLWERAYMGSQLASGDTRYLGLIKTHEASRRYKDAVDRLDKLLLTPRTPVASYAIHIWTLMLFAIALPLTWATGRLMVYIRIRRGLCPTCGYDLRASTLRCPECGTSLGRSGPQIEDVKI
jgi:hypothetical protein